MKKTILFLSLTTLPFLSFALDLDSAKKKGMVGEKEDGYIGAVSESPSDDVKALIEDINNKRREKYQDISRSNGQPLNVIEKLTAQKIYERLESGEYYVDDSGKWTKK